MENAVLLRPQCKHQQQHVSRHWATSCELIDSWWTHCHLSWVRPAGQFRQFRLHLTEGEDHNQSASLAGRQSVSQSGLSKWHSPPSIPHWLFLHGLLLSWQWRHRSFETSGILTQRRIPPPPTRLWEPQTSHSAVMFQHLPSTSLVCNCAFSNYFFTPIFLWQSCLQSFNQRPAMARLV